MQKRTTIAGVICTLLILAGAAAAASIHVYPVPWAPESGKTAMGTLTKGITFANISNQSEILIYTINGEQVKRIPITADTEKWDGKNDDGTDVASGVYLWVVKADDATTTGKLIVIR